MVRKYVITVDGFELGILWGITMREDLQDNIPESLRKKIHTLVDMAYETPKKEK